MYRIILGLVLASGFGVIVSLAIVITSDKSGIYRYIKECNKAAGIAIRDAGYIYCYDPNTSKRIFLSSEIVNITP